MRTLFFRIFLWFWMAVVVLAVTFAGIIVTTRFTVAREHFHAFKRAAAMSARAAAVSYEQDGVRGLEAVVNNHDACPTCVYFFDQRLSELQGLSAPSEVLALARTFLGSPARECLARPGWIACGAMGHDRTAYVLVMRFRIGKLVSASEWAILIPALMTVAALVCFWLARYLTQPISRLRRLTGRFAEGDLTARVEDYSAYSHSEELKGLAHDFDHMAERVQDLVEGQKKLLWDISHELRTPLTRIALAIGLSRQRIPGPPPKEFSRIDGEIARLNQLIGQILTMARLDAGSGEEDRQSVDLSALVREVARDATLEAEARNVTIRIECGSTVCVLGSPELLHVALENIVRNAIRHTVPSSVVTIQLLEAGTRASVAIDDHGPGVAEHDLPRLFEPFFRSAQARLDHPDGTGLGLAMTRRIIHRHGGSVTARNQECGGLVVTVDLPAGTVTPVAGDFNPGLLVLENHR